MVTKNEILKNYGLHENENGSIELIQKNEQEDIEKSIKDLKKEVTDRAIAGEEEAYNVYNRIVRKEDDSRVRIAKYDLENVVKEFNAVLAKDLRKSDNETNAQQVARIWTENENLYARFQKAEQILNNLNRDRR